MKPGNILVALAGQPNCGKSTVFNAVTGASQHVANYPGVTVDKKTGWFKHNGSRFEVVDLPGTYSLTSYSPEERVARDFILHEKPAVVVNVTDASNLKRSLYLSFQLMEMEIPMILELNMMDVAEKRGVEIDVKNLEQRLGVKAVPTSMKNGKGKTELLLAIESAAVQSNKRQSVRIDYGALEPYIKDIEEQLFQDAAIGAQYPIRWFALKLLEGDEAISGLVQGRHVRAGAFLSYVETLRSRFEERHGAAPEVHIAQRRYQTAEDIARTSIINLDPDKRTLTDKVDGVVCHRFAGPVILVGVIWLLYYLAIVQGYNLTNYTWPLLAKLRSLVESLTPVPGFIEIPLLRAFSLWFVDSINALLNYIPIFFILFALIAVLEDSGYMPRMAFIMDRLFGRFGLHGQSTLPMVLGGIYVGGCAVPGVMSCKGIPDERSRLATILIIPLLNCLAKVPLYVLLINIYFAAHKAWAMFFISTISLLMVLPVSKLLTLTVLKDKETAPFVMEMPPYHLPALRGVLGRAVERVWLFIRKITTIVAAVAVVIFALLQFPGLNSERMDFYEKGKEEAIARFYQKIENYPEHHAVLQGGALMDMVNYWEEYKAAKMMTQGEDAMRTLQANFQSRNPVFFSIAQPQNKEDKKVNREFKKLVKARNKLLREMKKERINNSFLGKLGKTLTPVTRYAGFDWKVNVALLSALAAKESSVATLGALYQPDESGQENQTLEHRMENDSEGFTPLHALALMLFMVLYPPCLATTIAVKVQTGSFKWMLFSMVYPMCLGLSAAVLVFSGGTALGLTGMQAMWAFYGLALAAAIAMGLVKNKTEYV